MAEITYFTEENKKAVADILVSYDPLHLYQLCRTCGISIHYEYHSYVNKIIRYISKNTPVDVDALEDFISFKLFDIYTYNYLTASESLDMAEEIANVFV